MTAVDPALGFVLAAVRRDAAAAQAREAAASPIADWGRVADLALRHDVPWWVHSALPRTAAADGARETLGDAVRALALNALSGVGQLCELVGMLRQAGVPVVAYKGPALAADVHGDITARRFTDLDVLIASRDRDRARGVLIANGYASPQGYTAREDRFYSAWEGVTHFERPDAPLPVELHWRVQAPRYGAPQDPAMAMIGARDVAVGGAAVPLPAIEVQAVLVALHGVKHAWTSLLWVADFAHAVDRAPFDWARFAGLAQAWRVSRAVHIALLVARELLALDIPAEPLARAMADREAVALAREAAQGLLSGTASPNAGRESTARYDLRWLDGSWARLRYLTLAAAMPTPQERKLVRLPDALLPLAYPVRAWRLIQHAVGRRA